jgi:hypothetical protein
MVLWKTRFQVSWKQKVFSVNAWVRKISMKKTILRNTMILLIRKGGLNNKGKIQLTSEH